MSAIAPTTSAQTTSSTSSTGSTSSGSSAAGGAVQSLGIGSGLDIASIVTQLTTAEGAAENTQLSNRKTDLQAQISAYGTFRSALEALQATLTPLENASKLQGRSVTVGDETIATATADGTATPAQYSISVQNLATAASLVSQPIVPGTVGTGTLAITVGGVTSKVTVDSSNNTLAGIAAAINSATDNPGVNASVVTTSGGDRLIINSTKTGALNAITVTQSGGDGGLAQLAYDPTNGIDGGVTGGVGLTQTQAAKDANFTINGFAATSASNQVTGVIGGVTLNLLKTTATDSPTTLTVGFDQKSTVSAVTNFVTAYNALITSVQALTSYDPNTKTAGTLLGNTTVNSLVSKIRSLFSQSSAATSSGATLTLADLGITSNVQGGFDQDSSKLTTALTNNLSAVTSLLTGKTGLAQKLDDALTQYTQPSGLLDTITNGLQSGLTDIATKQQDLQQRLDVYSATLTKQFNAMDAAVAALKQTQSYLTQQFNTLYANATAGK